METGSLFLALNFEEEIPERIMLIPPGKPVKGRDGREWKNPYPHLVAMNSNKRQPMLPIDENHSTDLAAPKGGASPAFGWMKDLCADETGAIWASVEWNDSGREALAKKEYRFISPVFLHNEKGEINCVLRAALTNTPNLNLPALNSERLENNSKENLMDKAVCAALGLPETATEAEVLAAVTAMKTSLNSVRANSHDVDLTAYAPRADVAAMEARALAAEKQLADLNAEALKKETEAAVDQAIKDRKISPASREQYLSLCSTRESLEGLKKAWAVSPAIIGDAPQAPAGTPPGTQTALNSEEAAMAKAAGYTTEEWNKLKEAAK